MINKSHIIRLTKEMNHTAMDNGEAYEETEEFTLYIGEDGTRYYEFDKTYKEN